MAFQQKQKQALRGVLQVEVAAIAVAGLCCSAPDDADRSANLPVEGYELFWADEFDGAALDSNKWQNYNPGKRRDAVNVDHAVTLDGQGHLVIATSRSGDDYHTGMIATRNKFATAFGYFECRARLQRQVGHWSAFWLQTPTMGKEIGNPAVSGTEIDIFEYLCNFGDSLVHNLHWDGYDAHHKTVGSGVVVPGLSGGWHTFGLLWSEPEYVFYVDGRQTWCTGQAVSMRDQFIILSLEVGEWAGDIARAVLPDSLLVDYVRVYKKR